MKILFLSSYVDPGSGASILIRLAGRLKKLGHEVQVLTPQPGFDSDITKSIRLPKVFDFTNKVINKITPNYFSLYYYQILREVRKYNPDIINIHWTHGYTIPIQIIPKLSQMYPIFWTIHDLWPITTNSFFEFTDGKTVLIQNQKLFRRIIRRVRFSPEILFRYKSRLLGKTDISTISPSKWLQNKVNSSAVFASAANYHIPNGVDINIFRPLDQNMLRRKYGVSDKDKVILFLSANLGDKRKGFYYFAKALDYLRASNEKLIENITVVIVGGNSSQADEFIPTRVKNLGSTRDIYKLAEYYNLADIFVSASIADNFPSTSLESLACGTPIVAFDVGGVSEIVINGKTGLLAESKDPVRLAENMQEILLNDKLREKLRENCRNYAVDNVSMDIFVRNYIELFENSFDQNAKDCSSAGGTAGM